MKVHGMNNYWFAILLFLGLGLFSGCLNNGSRQLIIDEVPFQICPVELPYDLPEERDFYFTGWLIDGPNADRSSPQP